MSTLDQAMNYIAEDVAFRKQYSTGITIPFTPPCDGFLIGCIRGSSSGRFYDTYSNTWPGIIDGYGGGSTYTSVTMFVRKNNTVTRTGTTNVQQRFYYFVPLGC